VIAAELGRISRDVSTSGFNRTSLKNTSDDAILSAALVIKLRASGRKDFDMNVSIGKRWQEFVEKTVEEGRYSSASEVVHEGLRLVEEREAKIAALRQQITSSIEEGGHFTPEEVDAELDSITEELKKQGY
jgi:antitoxin ParD1/3/4